MVASGIGVLRGLVGFRGLEFRGYLQEGLDAVDIKEPICVILLRAKDEGVERSGSPRARVVEQALRGSGFGVWG